MATKSKAKVSVSMQAQPKTETATFAIAMLGLDYLGAEWQKKELLIPFHMEGENYMVLTIKAGTYGDLKTTRHAVQQYPNGRWWCSCPHYHHRHMDEGFADKHIDVIRKALKDNRLQTYKGQKLC